MLKRFDHKFYLIIACFLLMISLALTLMYDMFIGTILTIISLSLYSVSFLVYLHYDTKDSTKILFYEKFNYSNSFIIILLCFVCGIILEFLNYKILSIEYFYLIMGYVILLDMIICSCIYYKKQNLNQKRKI